MKRMNQIKKAMALFALSSLFFILVACSKGKEKEEKNEEHSQPEAVLMEEPAERREFLMGTYIVLRVYDEGKEEVLDDAIARIE